MAGDGNEMTWAIYVTVTKDVILAGVAIFTATIAYKGINKWQKEVTFKAEFEVARSVIVATYNLREELKYARSPFVSAAEFPDDYRSFGVTNNAEAESKAWPHVYSNRYEPVREALIKFDSAVIEAEALWGKEIRETSLKLSRATNELRVSMEAIISDKFSKGEDFKDSGFGKKMRDNVEAKTNPKDELSIKIDNAINEIESILKPHLRR